MILSLKRILCVGVILIVSANTLSNKQNLLFISKLSPNIYKHPRDFSCNIFFGSSSVTNDTEEYRKQSQWYEHFKKIDDSTDTSGLPLAPENEDDPIEDVEHEEDLTKPPTSKEEWSLRRIAHGRRFWHKFFATPSEQTLRAVRWCKFTHDRFHCNRIVERTYTPNPPCVQNKRPDGTLIKMDKKQRYLHRNPFKITKKIIGYDNTGEESNLLILCNYPQERLVKLVERIRLPGMLDLRNFEILRFLLKTMLYLAKPNTFTNMADFLLCFGRLNTKYKSEFKKFMEIEERPKMRFKPMAYAIIGKLKCDPFPKELLITRKSKAPPIRDPYPVYNEPTSLLNRFLDSCLTLARHKITTTPYDHDQTMDRSFSDIFDKSPEYTTYGSVNKFDCPAVINFQEEMGEYLRTKRASMRKGFVGWSPTDVKNILTATRTLGLKKVETMIHRLKKLHNDIGFSYEDIINVGKTAPQVLRFGNYKLHCLRIYDIHEDFTHEMVNEMVRKFPNLLTYNIDRCIKPKIIYLTRQMGKSVKELLDFPKFLSFSLYDRIIPRHFSVMNKHYDGEFLSVYRFLFETGFYHSYGQPVTHPAIHDLLPENHAKYLESYYELSSNINLRDLLCPGDDKFCEIFNLTYRNLVEGKDKAFKIPLPTNIL